MENEDQAKKTSQYSRRDFLKVTGKVVVSLGLAGIPTIAWTDDGKIAVKVSEGYILVDQKKCQGCLSCMLACSLVHEGAQSLSLARIQVRQNSFAKWPDDLVVDMCRQCLDPLCVDNCPTGALHIDTASGNIRRIDKEKCLACGTCFEACPYIPHRVVIMPCVDDQENGEYGRKCDLCLETPFWQEKGGPYGKQACVQVCPVGALKFTSHLPWQSGDVGYKVNLRDWDWQKLGYPRF